MVKDALSFLSFARRLGGVSVAMRKRTKRIPRLSPIWRCAHFAFRPSPGECRQMLEELWRLLGRPSLCAALGLPIYTVESWRCGWRDPSGPGRRTIWLVWCLLLHPERLQSLDDLMTWGRLKVERRLVRRPASEWSDWCI